MHLPINFRRLRELLFQITKFSSLVGKRFLLLLHFAKKDGREFIVAKAFDLTGLIANDKIRLASDFAHGPNKAIF